MTDQQPLPPIVHDPLEHVTTDADGVRKWSHRTLPPEAIMVRRDEVQEGDVLYSSHGYNLVITAVHVRGTGGQTTELVGDLHEAGGPSRNEIYPSAGYVPVVRPGVVHTCGLGCSACAAHDPRDRRDHGHLPASMCVACHPEQLAPQGYPDADIVTAAGLEGMARGRDRVSWEDVARSALQQLGELEATAARVRAGMAEVLVELRGRVAADACGTGPDGIRSARCGPTCAAFTDCPGSIVQGAHEERVAASEPTHRPGSSA